MLPADLKPRSIFQGNCISVSEFGTLADCEWKWDWSYAQENKRDSLSVGRGLSLGTLMHELLAEFWKNGGEAWPGTDDETAEWLMFRYSERYGSNWYWKDVQTDIPFAVLHPAGFWVFGYWDALATDRHGRHWVVEHKTMAQWNRIEQLPVDMQSMIYTWAARESGYDVAGVLWDAIRTYKPAKNPDDLPLDETFDRRVLIYTDAQIQGALDQLESAHAVRVDLTVADGSVGNIYVAGGPMRKPMKNVGQSCSFCAARADCYGIKVELLD